MAIPEDRASTVSVAGNILPPNDRFRDDKTSYHIGGVGISDASKGLEYQVWVAVADDHTVIVFPEADPSNSQVFVTGATKINRVALAFDQNMRPVIAYSDDGLAKLFFYDTVAQDYSTNEYPGIQSPFCVMDDTRDAATLTDTNDVLFIYISGGLKYRQQRDRYTIERTLSPIGSGRIARAGMTDRLRLQVELE